MRLQQAVYERVLRSLRKKERRLLASLSADAGTPSAPRPLAASNATALATTLKPADRSAPIKPRMQLQPADVITDPGYAHLARGWFDVQVGSLPIPRGLRGMYSPETTERYHLIFHDSSASCVCVQGQGVPNDYCRYVGDNAVGIWWSCALAGGTEQYTPPWQYNYTSLPGAAVAHIESSTQLKSRSSISSSPPSVVQASNSSQATRLPLLMHPYDSRGCLAWNYWTVGGSVKATRFRRHPSVGSEGQEVSHSNHTASAAACPEGKIQRESSRRPASPRFGRPDELLALVKSSCWRLHPLVFLLPLPVDTAAACSWPAAAASQPSAPHPPALGVVLATGPAIYSPPSGGRSTLRTPLSRPPPPSLPRPPAPPQQPPPLSLLMSSPRGFEALLPLRCPLPAHTTQLSVWRPAAVETPNHPSDPTCPAASVDRSREQHPRNITSSIVFYPGNTPFFCLPEPWPETSEGEF